jgi:cytochrome c-type biogenesis protein CcmE
MRITLIIIVFLSAVGALVAVGLGTSIPEMRLAQLLAEEPGASPDRARGEVTCQLKDGQVAEIESLAPLRFTITSRTDSRLRMKVTSARAVPENFKVGIDVGLKGTYDPQSGVFDAYTVTTKCPSRYEASKEVGDGKAEPGVGYPAPAPEGPPGA